MQKRKNGGFTLVELIVVIAILAILAGVGAVAYSGYIEYTKKGVDRKTVGEIMNALELADYADPSLFGEDGGAMVGLTKDGIQVLYGPSGLTDALKDAFGDDLSSTKLTYDWDGADFSKFSGMANRKYVSEYTEKIEEDGVTNYSGHLDEVWDAVDMFVSALNGDQSALGNSGVTGDYKGNKDYLDKIVTYTTGDDASKIQSAWEQGRPFVVVTSDSANGLSNNPTVFGARLARNFAFALYAQTSDSYDAEKMSEELEKIKINAGEDIGDPTNCFRDSPNKDAWNQIVSEYNSSGTAKQDARTYLGMMQAADEIRGDNKGDQHLDDFDFLKQMSDYVSMLDPIFSGDVSLGEDGLGKWASVGSHIIVINAHKENGRLICEPSPEEANPRENDSSSNEILTPSITLDVGSGNFGNGSQSVDVYLSISKGNICNIKCFTGKIPQNWLTNISTKYGDDNQDSSSVATLENGVITAKSVGTVKITVTKTGKKSWTATIIVHVSE